ncbi:MAG: carboxypeptidase-like regulatory domain-containing protein [Bacteroidales bacterium]
MKNKIFLFLIFLSFVCHVKSLAQAEKNTDTSRVYTFRGKLVDNENKPLAFANIINKLRGHTAVSDSGGNFQISVVYKDSLRISAIGFQTKHLFIKDKLQKDTVLHVIVMSKKTYDLATVNIYELRWQVFKAEFMEEKVEEDKTAIRISNWMANLVPSDELRMIFQAARGPGFSLNFKTKADKSRKKVNELEKKYQLIAPKYNDKLITEITGLKGLEIYEFTEFCNFDEAYLMQATEYEIMEVILEKWKEYEQLKKNKEKTKNLLQNIHK